MLTNSLKNISTTALDNKLKSLKSSENGILAELILHLSELDERKAFRELGYSSLFTYCTEALGYSSGAAYRRVEAARCLKTNPEIYDLIKVGKINLCAVAEINKIKEVDAKTEVINAAEGKSKEAVKILTTPFLPAQKPKKEIIKPISVKTETKQDLSSNNLKCEQNEIRPNITQYRFSIEVQDEFMRLYQEAKALIGHVPASEVFMRCMKEFVTKRKTIKRKTTKASSAKSKRFIPKSTKVEVRKRDVGQCTFVAADGRRCTETHGLEFDHIKPTSDGGSSEINNLRLVCRAHNLLHAERFFGVEKIREYSQRER